MSLKERDGRGGGEKEGKKEGGLKNVLDLSDPLHLSPASVDRTTCSSHPPAVYKWSSIGEQRSAAVGFEEVRGRRRSEGGREGNGQLLEIVDLAKHRTDLSSLVSHPHGPKNLSLELVLSSSRKYIGPER